MFLSLYDLDFPPKKQSGIINYCLFPIHKRGSSWKCMSSRPLLQYIHCEEIIAQNSCFRFPPGWLLLGMEVLEKPQNAAPPQHVTPLDPSTALPLTTLKTRTFCNPSCSDQLLLHRWPTICSCKSSKDGLRGPWTLDVFSRNAMGCWFLFQTLKGWHCSSGLTWGQTLQRGVHRKIPGFVSCHWKWLWVFWSYYPRTPQSWSLL